jgi:hypothetical protein
MKTRIGLAILSCACSIGLAADLVPLTPTAKNEIAKYLQAKKNKLLGTSPDDASVDTMADAGFALDVIGKYEAHLLKLGLSEQAGSIYQHRRIDKMAGSSAGGGATTNAVSKPGVSDLFSAALENGSLTRTQEGTATTFRVNAYGIYSLFHPPSGDCSITDPICPSGGIKTLRGLSASLTIDNSTGQSVVPANAQTTTGSSTATTQTLIGLAKQGGRISAAGAHFDLLRRTMLSDTDKSEWEKALKGVENEAVKFSAALAGSEALNPQVKLFANCVETQFREISNQWAAIKPTPPDKDLQGNLEVAYQGCITDLYNAIPPARHAIISNLSDARSAYNIAMANALHDVLFKSQLSVEYTHDIPADQPEQSTFRIIVDKKFWGEKTDPLGSLTFNGGITFYESVPAGVKTGRLRDAQAALQFERKVGKTSWQNRPVVSLAGYYQYQVEKSILKFDSQSQTPIVPIPLPQPAVVVLDNKGGIGVVQGKLTIPVAGALSVPIAVSWSNRTELLKANEVRGQFGISIDLDKLLGKTPQTP